MNTIKRIAITLSTLLAVGCGSGDPVSIKETEEPLFFVCELKSGNDRGTITPTASVDTHCVGYYLPLKDCALGGVVHPIWCDYGSQTTQSVFSDFKKLKGSSCKEIKDIERDNAYGISTSESIDEHHMRFRVVADAVKDRWIDVYSTHQTKECSVEAQTPIYPQRDTNSVLATLDKIMYTQKTTLLIIPEVTNAWLSGTALEEKLGYKKGDHVVEYIPDP